MRTEVLDLQLSDGRRADVEIDANGKISVFVFAGSVLQAHMEYQIGPDGILTRREG